MKQVFYSFGLVLVCIACGNDTAEVVVPVQPFKDTVVTEIANPISPELLAKFKKKTELPFVQDSVYLQKLSAKTESNLTREELQYLTRSFVESDIVPSARYQLNDFFILDSMLAAGDEMPAIEASKGMIITYSIARTSQQVKLGDSASVLLWTITYRCAPGMSPNAHGTVLYASLLISNEVTSCVAVGEDDFYTDAPHWNTILTTCSLTAERHQSHRVLFDGGDTDKNGNEIVTRSTAIFALDIVDGSWKVAKIE